ncbi:hypothetical protein RFI_12837 [Reticulomyxa filosa]|uniref:Uncharacterized protein n=1 Tax=Reticulomyxa filosa TaxID=46433 RepID=X6NG57_RETFI|nr:hypothetical protein RFI_12837 [Reticulomyxa filosa]|eukprot:ETO24322.1 hypothetical protein RFI_12837 [Reticulomyxa filosa]
MFLHVCLQKKKKKEEIDRWKSEAETNSNALKQAKMESEKKSEEIKNLTVAIEQAKEQIAKLSSATKMQKDEVQPKTEPNPSPAISSSDPKGKAELKEEKKANEKDLQQVQSLVAKSCEKMVNDVLSTSFNKTLMIKNRECCHYKFGVYLLGDCLRLTVDCKKEDRGHLNIKTSHLWIKHAKSVVDCSGLGYNFGEGPGKGENGKTSSWSNGGGAGYGTNGGESDATKSDGKGGKTYGEDSLLKELLHGSGGGCGWDKHGNMQCGGRGGGIIELTIEQQLINNGTIQANGWEGKSGWSGGGSGGSILIKFQSLSNATTLQHTFGNIHCLGGGLQWPSRGGKGRIAIHGIKLSTDALKKIDPKPYNF